VIDASVIPVVTSANTYIPTIAVAEKGAALIKAGLIAGFCGSFPAVLARNRGVAAFSWAIRAARRAARFGANARREGSGRGHSWRRCLES
jgi:choline dehydrogenase-like flavoprotein